jgi:uncharacterized protein (TIGR00251 family)
MSWLNRDAESLQINLRIVPRASRNQVVGISNDRLKLKITAAPVDGKANEALVRYLSDLFSVAKSRIEIVRGHKGREKTVRISPPPELPEVLAELVTI